MGSDAFIDRITSQNTQGNSEVTRADRAQLNPSIDAIADAVSDVFGVSRDHLFAVRKGRGVKNMPRKVGMYLAQKIGDYRLTEIADAFGLSHYGSVSNAIHHVSEEIRVNEEFSAEVEAIINRFDP